ncbi:hypothetical protein [Natrinema gelatinilyticum]|uniref:hypothetical protein n=1 Tax=Natrinema gelatinilyticum TaxID=2961571 RepID=UPI0020C1F23C|nr:hypothetical protein [Natrinema gelatinilyticum]
MKGKQDRFNGNSRVLHRRAVRTPLPDAAAERVFHENMMALADARDRKADLLADPDVTLLDAYDAELERIADSVERQFRVVAGEEFEEAAMAYNRGERDDPTGALATYYSEGLWRIQQRTTITEMLFSPLILRYPDCVTVNIRFATGYSTQKSIHYESPEHSTEDLPDEHAQTYYQESLYSQKRAAAYLRETSQIIREEFPHPDETTFEERKYGGIVAAGGRRGSVFSALLERVDPDPDRFSGPATGTTLVQEGPEARRTERELFSDGELVY